MNASHETPLHGDGCRCDDCYESGLVDRTQAQIADFLAARARTYPPFTDARLAVQADADAVRRGAWRKR